MDDLLITQRAADLGIKLRPEYVQDIIEEDGRSFRVKTTLRY